MKRCLAVLWLASALTAPAGTASLLSGDENWRMNFRPEFQFSKVGGEFAGLAGAQVGVSLQRSFYIGVAGYGLVNSITPQGPASRLSAFDFWYTGGFLDVTLFANQTVHGSINAVFAGGQVKPDGAESATVFVAWPRRASPSRSNSRRWSSWVSAPATALSAAATCPPTAISASPGAAFFCVLTRVSKASRHRVQGLRV